jgi:hypothetical protein
MLELSPWIRQIEGVSFYNLEVNPDRLPSPKIAQAIAGGLNLFDYGAALASFDDTAALIANLDIVLGCETAVMHLAGALGKPTWLMVDTNTHWVWGREGNRTPWYPSARIFRQQRIHLSFRLRCRPVFPTIC